MPSRFHCSIGLSVQVSAAEWPFIVNSKCTYTLRTNLSGYLRQNWSVRVTAVRLALEIAEKNSYIPMHGQSVRDSSDKPWERVSKRQQGRNCSAWIFHGWALAQCGYRLLRWLHHIVRHCPLCERFGHLRKGCKVAAMETESRFKYGYESRLREIPEVTWTFPIYGTS